MTMRTDPDGIYEGAKLAVDANHRIHALNHGMAGEHGPETLVLLREVYGMPENLLSVWSNSENGKGRGAMDHHRHVNLARALAKVEKGLQRKGGKIPNAAYVVLTPHTVVHA